MTKFVISTEHIYWWPVKVLVPDPENAGQVLEQDFKARFRAMSKDEAKALEAELSALPSIETVKREDDVLRRVLLGWDADVVGEDGKPVPFSTQALEAAMQFSWFRIGCYRAYRQSMQAEAARLGN